MIKIKIDRNKQIGFEEFYRQINNTENYISSKDYLQKQIRELEQAYKMDSQSFYRKFTSGFLPDKYDFLKWAHLWETYKDNYPENRGEVT